MVDNFPISCYNSSRFQAKENSAPAGTRCAASCVYTEYDAQKHDIDCVSLRHIYYITFLGSVQYGIFHEVDLFLVAEFFFWLF